MKKITFFLSIHKKVNLSGCRYDRILWYGKGVTQLSYFRSESKFSDHRPVSALFSTQVEVEKSTNPKVVSLQTILLAIQLPKATVSFSNSLRISVHHISTFSLRLLKRCNSGLDNKKKIINAGTEQPC